MLKPRNILIIFILNYLVLLLASSFIELIFISNKAQEAQLLMMTAADMALDQVQATDDFFITGGGYFINSSNSANFSTDMNSYKSSVIDNTGNLKEIEIFKEVAGLDSMSTGRDAVAQIYNILYFSKMKDFILGFDGNTKSVLDMVFPARAVVLRSLPMGYTDSEGWQTQDSYELVTLSIPLIAQMGKEIKVNGKIQSSDIFNFLTCSGSNPTIKYVGTGYGSLDTAFLNVAEMYNLNHAEKTHYLSTEADYFMTPISLGITYINEDLLQAFFMNNLELLMRSKYINNDAENNYGVGVYKGTYGGEMVDEDSVSFYNPINNGSFTLLRGADKISESIYRGMMPKIEYTVIDMYNSDNNPEVDKMLRQILGAKTTVLSGGSSSLAVATDSNGRSFVSGATFRAVDNDMIQAQSQVYGSDVFSKKPIVVAKVTFYADFIIPYMTPSIREMRGRVDNDSTLENFGRTLFNPFTYSTLNGGSVPQFDQNYVNIKNASEDFANVDSVFNDNTTIDGDTHRSAMAYTTFFAVVP